MISENQSLLSQHEKSSEEGNHQATDEKIDHLRDKLSEPIIHKAIFSLKCSECKEEIQLSEGDVIYGDKWYHKSCWKQTQKIELASH